MKLTTYKQIYFLGIGGIGMSNLARYFKSKGLMVAGYDRTRTPLTIELENEGIAVHYEDVPGRWDPAFSDKSTTLVVRTPAVPANLGELLYVQNNGYTILKRAEVLGLVSADSKGLCIAGTHGKTTTSMMTAHLLKQSSVDCNAFLGGISNNYNTNLLLSQTSDLTVIEADEYDRSFHTLNPWMAVVTSVDPDHLDIYGTHSAVKEAFVQFAGQVSPDGSVVLKAGVDLDLHLSPRVTLYRYSALSACDFYAADIRLEEGGMYTFDLHYPGGVITDCRLGVPGKMNVENAVGAAALALLHGVDPQAVKEALATFTGVERRMDVRYISAKCCYIDDYAHHPAELRASISSVREWYPHRRLTGIFQPHLYSRTKDFYADFAKSLSLLDRVILLPIYPARETPLPGVTSQLILDKITLKDKCIMEPSQVAAHIVRDPEGVWMTLGAGNIDRLVPQITAQLNQLGI